MMQMPKMPNALGGQGGIPGQSWMQPPPGYAQPLAQGGPVMQPMSGMQGGPTMNPGVQTFGGPQMMHTMNQPPQQLGSGGQIQVDQPMGGGMDSSNALHGVGMGHFAPQMQGFFSAMQDWRGQRPDRPDGMMDQTQRQDWRGQMQDWRQGRPTFQSYFGMGGPGMNGGGPVMAPGGGGTGAPLQGPSPLPPTQVGMVPGVPGSMGLNPGTGLAPGVMPMTNQYQLPTYGG